MEPTVPIYDNPFRSEKEQTTHLPEESEPLWSGVREIIINESEKLERDRGSSETDPLFCVQLSEFIELGGSIYESQNVLRRQR